MTLGTRIPVRAGKASPYANREDFGKLFIEDLNGLYQLSFLLTGDHKKAEECFVAGIEDCANENRVFKEWARSWAKRTIIRNAIRTLRPRPGHSGWSPTAGIPYYSRQSSASDQPLDAFAVLGLKDFERFVVIMSVLEHYSLHDCALLLGCTTSEVREARARALENLAAARQPVALTAEP
jgi:DNA-directed RNA polymerase specialized sigma24 family protein